MVHITISLGKKGAKDFQVRASLVASPRPSGFCTVGPMLLDLCVSERERMQALNPCGHICLENTTLIEPSKARFSLGDTAIY